ncbi:MAG TPA: molybdopterin cofactor-binding domain-containing protein, partial [Casimicrobiaceae bacterium]|nr:molybdopterin cofactor-binding domain-containing protein [Casimicrobiaceae bacterium]
TEWASIAASRAINTTWSEWAGLPDQAKLWEYVRGTKLVKDEDFQKVGDAAEGLKTPNAKMLKATYDFAIHTHGSIGPSCAVAEYVDGKITCWSASQQTHLLRKQIAMMLKMKPEDVRCIYIEGAGCYGRNGHEDAAADACLIAKETELPVRVQWMREDEHGWDPKGPPTLYDYAAALDAQGNVVGWHSQAFLPVRPTDHLVVALLPAELAGLPTDPSHPGNIQASLGIPYTFPNIRATAHWLAETPFRPSWIRTPGRMQNTFGNESFIDEIVASIGADPFEFRLKHLNDPRGAELLKALAELAAWKPQPVRSAISGDVARGRGVAYTKYELVRTYVATVADVEVNLKTGAIRVPKFYVAHDCGQIINPDGLRNQIEGNVVQTVSRTLLEELKFDRSRVTSLDWASYPILTFPDVPDVAIKLIDRPNEKPWGAGEPTAALVSAAIANAVFNATGARMRSVPFTPEKMEAALKTPS